MKVAKEGLEDDEVTLTGVAPEDVRLVQEYRPFRLWRGRRRGSLSLLRCLDAVSQAREEAQNALHERRLEEMLEGHNVSVLGLGDALRSNAVRGGGGW